MKLKRLHGAATAFLMFSDVAELITDWLFYIDVRDAEKGIVYGPIRNELIIASLIFAIIGTLFFAAEIVHTFLEVRYHFEAVDSDYLSLFGVVVTEIPHLVISLNVALCREEPISAFQFTKAVVIIISMSARTVIIVVKYFHKKQNGKLDKHHLKTRMCIVIGNTVPVLFSIVLFALNYMTKNDKGEIYFRTPSALANEKFSEKTYFTNVSVFMYVPELDVVHNTTGEPLHWVRVFALTDFESNTEKLFRLDIDKSKTGQLMIGVWAYKVKDNLSSWSLSGCYTVGNNRLTNAMNSTCDMLSTSFTLKTMYLKFEYRQAGSMFRTKLLGGIYVNVKVLQHSVCKTIDKYAESLEDARGAPAIVLHYYRTNSSSEDAHFLRSQGQIRFYKNDGVDMMDVRQVWKTGWRNCNPTGSTGPVLDKSRTIQGTFCSF